MLNLQIGQIKRKKKSFVHIWTNAKFNQHTHLRCAPLTGDRVGVLLGRIYCIMLVHDRNHKFHEGLIKQKHNKTKKKKRRLAVWSQEGVKEHQINFLAKPQKMQPCIIQGTGADLCGSLSLPPPPKLTRQKQLSLLATVTKPWVVARKFLQRSTSVADRPLCSSTRVQQFILSPSAMFRDQGLSSTRRTAHEMPAWKETRANAQTWGRTAVEVLNFSVFIYCWVPDLNSGPDLLDRIH